MNLFKSYIESLPIDIPLSFGISENVRLTFIDIDDRLTRKGDISPKNFFMEFISYDEDDVATARDEFSFFKLNAERMEFIEMNFNDQFNKLLHLAVIMYNDNEKLQQVMAETNDTLFGKPKGLAVLADGVFAYNSRTIKKKPKLDVLKKEVAELNSKLNEFFYKIIFPVVGKTSVKMSLLAVVDKKGYKQLPDETDFVSVEDDLEIAEKYLTRKTLSEKPEVEDEVGDDDDTDEDDTSSDEDYGTFDDDDFEDDDFDDDGEDSKEEKV